MAISASVMMPIVFCASLVPCASASSAAGDELPEPEAAVDRARAQAADDPVDDAGSRARRRRRRGSARSSAGTMTFSTQAVAVDRADAPLAANAAPTTPPISACEELDGSPKYQVTRFQAIAPIRPAKTIVVRDRAGVDDALGDRRGDRERDEGADEVQQRRRARPRPAAASRASRSTSRRRWRCRGSRW